MPPCRLQTGAGFENIGPPLKLKRIYQTGGGRKRVPLYSQPDFYLPNRVQHGAGIGSLFIPLFRYLAPKIGPLLTSGLNAVKNELLSTGIDILQNPTKENLKKRSLKAVENLSNKADKKIKLMTGSGAKRGRKKRIKRLSQRNSKHSLPKRRQTKNNKKNKKTNKKVVRRGRRKIKKGVFSTDIFT